MNRIGQLTDNYLVPMLGENGKRYFAITIPATFSEDELNDDNWFVIRRSLLANLFNGYSLALDEIEEAHRK